MKDIVIGKRPRDGKRKGVAKVPVIMQLEALECGAACLTMVLAYFGKWKPLEEIRKQCGVSRDGSNAKNMLKAARSYGLVAKAYKLETAQLKQCGKYPCIIHWNFNHFVVLDGFTKRYAVLNDPARGTVRVTLEEFDRSFTGIVLLFEPGESFVCGGKQKSVLAFAKKQLRGSIVAVAFTALMTCVSALIGIIQPGFSRVFLDRLLTQKNPDWLLPFILGLTALSALQIIISLLQQLQNYKINGKLGVVINAKYMWHILRLPMDFFSQRMAGDLISRKDDNEEVISSIVNTFAPLALNFVMMIFYLGVMINYSPLLTAVGLVSIVLNMLCAKMISKKRVNITRIQMRDAGKLASSTISGINMIETIKASGAENGYFERWAGLQASVNTQKVRYERLNQCFGMLPSIVSSLSDTVVLVLGVWLTMRGEFTVGMIMAFQGFMTSFTTPVTSFIEAGQMLQETRTSMERIEDVMEYPEDVKAETELDLGVEHTKLSGSFEMRNVSFGYSPLGEPLIRNFSLNVKQGGSVALVGTSGCGKSTISKLISGLNKPWEGEILFDGKRIEEINRTVLTGSLAVVDQEIIMFEDTIANNIKMWDNSIEDFEMILAARDAQLHEDIMQREGGYQYKISEGGTNFSGGQRQRFEIARVLAQDPTIIIMDEATSALDAQTEFDVVRSIRNRGITCVIIAHRLSTIKDCDEIIVLDHGTVVERGTHEELYASDGVYRSLVTNE